MSRAARVRRVAPAQMAGLLVVLAWASLSVRPASAQSLFVSVTSPTNGSTVGGTVTVTANANPLSLVQGVQFTLDGVNLGAEDTSSPYSTPWNTLAATNGSHPLRAVARNAC